MDKLCLTIHLLALFTLSRYFADICAVCDTWKFPARFGFMSLILLRSYRHHAKVWTRPSSKSSFIRSLASRSNPTSSFEHVRRVFDDDKYYQDFNNGTLSRKIFSGPRTGLFKNEKLTTPQGLIDFSGQCLTEAQTLVDTMIREAETSDQGKIHYIRRLDPCCAANPWIDVWVHEPT